VKTVDELDIEELEKMMEELAMAPREEMGIRQPGEKQAREKYGTHVLHDRT
jgi:hypothetical protein